MKNQNNNSSTGLNAGTPSNWFAIFDWDGVVVDSARQHEHSWELLAAETGLPLPPGHFQRGFGIKAVNVITDILEWTRDPAQIAALADRKEVLYREICAKDGVQPLPGAKEWIEQLRAAGIRCAIGSATSRRNIDFLLRQFGLDSSFDVIAAAEDASKSKPDPEVFLVAAQKLGADPARCVVFEDAPMGVAAARAAGMRVIAVQTTNPPEALAAADRIVERLDALSVEEMGRWFL